MLTGWKGSCNDEAMLILFGPDNSNRVLPRGVAVSNPNAALESQRLGGVAPSVEVDMDLFAPGKVDLNLTLPKLLQFRDKEIARQSSLPKTYRGAGVHPWERMLIIQAIFVPFKMVECSPPDSQVIVPRIHTKRSVILGCVHDGRMGIKYLPGVRASQI